MSNSKYVCFDCRSVYNRDHRQCSTCKGDVKAIGKFFKAPKKSNDEEWQAIKILYDAGIRYESSSGKYRSTLLDDYLQDKQPLTEQELLYVLERATWLYQCYVMKWVSGERPRHPREAKAYLGSIETKKQTMFDIIQSVADKLGRDHPEVKRLIIRLNENQSND